ncbi:hypothetical protein BB558_005131 [Smittium angustum]|uniref:Peptidase S1 domain-containing protein n=1 Tax=Smittium angustum TaxID=133377 RepID=A0A2U1J1K0_SMIAN|nr:hypothetical protein BB558_005131 [Smittium angustum]
MLSAFLALMVSADSYGNIDSTPNNNTVVEVGDNIVFYEDPPLVAEVLGSTSFLAALFYLDKNNVNRRLCSATILSNSILLTSDKCISQSKALFGEGQFNILVEGEDRFYPISNRTGILTSTVMFDQNSMLGIIKLSSPILLNDTVKAVPISIRSMATGDPLYLLKTAVDTQIPFTALTLADPVQCNAFNNSYALNSTSILCTSPTNEQALCDDQLGGDPILAITQSRDFVLMGISGNYISNDPNQNIACKDPKSLRFNSRPSDYLGFLSLSTNLTIQTIISSERLLYSTTDNDDKPILFSKISNLTQQVNNAKNTLEASKTNSTSNSTVNSTSTKKSSSFKLSLNYSLLATIVFGILLTI